MSFGIQRRSAFQSNLLKVSVVRVCKVHPYACACVSKSIVFDAQGLKFLHHQPTHAAAALAGAVAGLRVAFQGEAAFLPIE